MRTETRTINIYTFDELSESAQENVLNHFRETQCAYEWWDYIYDDAERV